jgi:hypothetical protein
MALPRTSPIMRQLAYYVLLGGAVWSLCGCPRAVVLQYRGTSTWTSESEVDQRERVEPLRPGADGSGEKTR